MSTKRKSTAVKKSTGNKRYNSYQTGVSDALAIIDLATDMANGRNNRLYNFIHQQYVREISFYEDYAPYGFGDDRSENARGSINTYGAYLLKLNPAESKKRGVSDKF